MGSRVFPDEQPVHEVRISQPFYLGKYPVTQGQWEAVLGNNPSCFRGDRNRPVENVSWHGVQEFIRQLNAREGGMAYRLPTETEWEYAARADTTTDYCFGDDRRQLKKYAWYEANSGAKTHAVGQLKPNVWGLYDMHGNVWEWTQDWYDEEYYDNSPHDDPPGPSAGSYRVVRGGGWDCGAGDCRSASRAVEEPSGRSNVIGFRLLRKVP
jgi:formylglycine-generating enzyme required for sulfatase activity